MPETLILTLPPEARLARLGSLVTLHFLRHNGLTRAAARRAARAVEGAFRRLVGTAGRGGRLPRTVRLRMTAGDGTVVVTGLRPGRRATTLIRACRSVPR